MLPTSRLRVRRRSATALQGGVENIAAIVRRVRQFREPAHRRVPWTWHEAPELTDGIAIADLVSPLRYDVIVRRDFFIWYRERADLARRDLRAFIAEARATSYHHWWMTSETIRCRPELMDRPEELERLFDLRVERSVRLAERVARTRHADEHPIILKTADRLLAPTTFRDGPPSGKPLPSQQYFLADGCHRVALMLADGVSRIEPGHFLIKRYLEFSPFDSTSVLVPSLPVDPATYVRFLGWHYGQDAAINDVESLVGWVQEHDAARWPELEAMLAVDGMAPGHRMAQGRGPTAIDERSPEGTPASR
jgi:hypothetical protein